ncbi:hypothetical protein AT05_08000 [Schleiferia thermophila str. Yellowstone]|nr:hypothetical protein AT05_08000 [Schleiferia thermophila str. Yellowstone]
MILNFKELCFLGLYQGLELLKRQKSIMQEAKDDED